MERTVRAPQGGYLVPRGDGRYVLGATVEERGCDTAPTAGGVFELLRDLREVIPGVLELEIEEVAAGLRPGTPDNLPSIGAGRARGPRVGHRPLPQRHPAHAADRRARAAALGGEALPEVGRARRPAPLRPGVHA